MMDLPFIDRWGPWADGLSPGERLARIRCLRAIAHLTCGPRGAELNASLLAAEINVAALPEALVALNRLASLDRRRVLASYAALTAPTRPALRTGECK